MYSTKTYRYNSAPCGLACFHDNNYTKKLVVCQAFIL
ncbi:hypothetical protein 7t3_0179 [Salmonella phage 7t3]|nr:hypothetical protein 7t3_0179 [Salmonella phage 7t3]